MGFAVNCECCLLLSSRIVFCWNGFEIFSQFILCASVCFIYKVSTINWCTCFASKLYYMLLPTGYVDQSGMFSAVHSALANGGCIGIFPEGGSHDRTDLLPLKVRRSVLCTCMWFVWEWCGMRNGKAVCIFFVADAAASKSSVHFLSTFAILSWSSYILVYFYSGWRGSHRPWHPRKVRHQGSHCAHRSHLLQGSPVPRTTGGGVWRTYLHHSGM